MISFSDTFTSFHFCSLFSCCHKTRYNSFILVLNLSVTFLYHLVMMQMLRIEAVGMNGNALDALEDEGERSGNEAEHFYNISYFVQKKWRIEKYSLICWMQKKAKECLEEGGCKTEFVKLFFFPFSLIQFWRNISFIDSLDEILLFPSLFKSFPLSTPLFTIFLIPLSMQNLQTWIRTIHQTASAKKTGSDLLSSQA